MAAPRARCWWCRRRIALTPSGLVWAHGRPLCHGAGDPPERRPAGLIPEAPARARLWGRRVRTVRVVGDRL